MNKHRIECIACSESFRSEREYSKHDCKPPPTELCLKEERMDEDYDIDDENIIVKLEPNDFLENSEDIDPLSFTSVKEENISFDEHCLDVKNEDEPELLEKGVVGCDDEQLTAVASSYLSQNTNLKCKACCKTFQNHRTFNRHVISAHNTFKPYACKICDKKFLQKHYVTLHMRVHTGERPYACPLCPKKYTHKTSFTIHMRIHRGERPYECGICGKKCYDKSGLTSHIRSHTKETPYKCDVCDRRFTHSKSLLVHKRNHTGEKPYICKHCGKAFRHWHKHKIHVRLHTGERPYKCKVCGKGFPRNDEVKRHMRSHTGIKSFRCSICGVYCATQLSIAGHINIHHSNLTKGDSFSEPEKVITAPIDSSTVEPEAQRSIYKNIAQQSSYVANILMTAKHNEERKKARYSTKVIEITTKETPLNTLRSKLRNYSHHKRDEADHASKLDIAEKKLSYSDFLAWQEKMLEKQGLVVKGLPSSDNAGEQQGFIKNRSVTTKQQSTNMLAVNQQLSNKITGKQQLANSADGKQQYILLTQPPSQNATGSKLLVPISSGGKFKKAPIDVPSVSVGTTAVPRKPYLIVPESVAAQPMFLLSSGSQKMYFLPPPVQSESTPHLFVKDNTSSVKSKEKTVNSSIEGGSAMLVKTEPET